MQDPFRRIPNLQQLLHFIGSIPNNELVKTNGKLTRAGVHRILCATGSIWHHSGNPKAPHAAITSERCTDMYVNVPQALSYPLVCDILAFHMAQAINDMIDQLHIARDEVGVPTIGWVVGSNHGAAVFSQNVARYLGARHDFPTKGPNDTQLWERFVIGRKEPVLQVEEMFTTGKTTYAVRFGIRHGNPGPVTFLPFVTTLVHRSKVHEVEGGPILSLIHYKTKEWPRKECPLCQAGSERLRPRENHNWEKLMHGR